MAKVLITGGAGFIGSHIARELLAADHEVFVFDSFVQYISPLNSHYQKSLELRFQDIQEKVEIIRGDVVNKYDLQRTMNRLEPTHIIHLAALPLADFSNIYSEEALNSILHSTVNILEIIRDVNYVERFVYTSSSMVYGDFEKIPAPEDHPKRPKDVYGGTKYAGEVLTESFGRRYQIPYTIIRPSAVYGPTDINRRVSQIFIENALSGKKLVLHGGGNTMLDFSYVTDVAKGFVVATFHSNGENEVFNITQGEGRSLLDFADIVKSHIPETELEIIEEEEIFRPKRGSLDIQKAKDILGYMPEFTLEQGIARYIQFMRDYKLSPA